MSTQHPITPPHELVREWARFQNHEDPEALWRRIATLAAQWGADQELEACIDVLGGQQEWDILSQCTGWKEFRDQSEEILRAARRPEPPSLNSIALQMLGTIEREGHYIPEITDTIRLALEALMTKQHRATPEQWAQQALWVETCEDSSCIMELLHRIEALEAAQQALWVETCEDSSCFLEIIGRRVNTLEAAQQRPPHQDKLDRLIIGSPLDGDDGEPIVLPSSPADLLIDRVGKAIYDALIKEAPGIVQARAAIREVAAWLREHTLYSATSQIAADLEYEANR